MWIHGLSVETLKRKVFADHVFCQSRDPEILIAKMLAVKKGPQAWR